MRFGLNRRFAQGLIAAGVLGLLAPLVDPSPGVAGPKSWIGGDGDVWNDAAKWNPAGQPQAGDDVSLTQNGAAEETVNYRSAINPLLNSLLIEGTGGGNMILSQGADGLKAANGTIAKTGKGEVREFGGTQEFTQNLTIGDTGTAVGTFRLSLGGKLTVGGNEVIGNSGTGTFTQSDTSAHSVAGILTLGNNFLGGVGNGTYNLTGGTLTTSGGTVVGDAGTGTFNQTLGTHTAMGGLVLGKTAFLGIGGNGTYNLSAGVVDGGAGTAVGLQGTGKFVQTGGIHRTDNLVLGSSAFARGTYDFSSGNITVRTNLFVGDAGTGIFTQSGGDQTVTNVAILGNMAGASGTYNLKDGTLTVGGETIGSSGTGMFQHSGGTNTADSLELGSLAGSSGKYTLTGGGKLIVNGFETIGRNGAGTFVQGNGNDAPDHMINPQPRTGLGGDLSLAETVGTGNYTLNSGKLTVSGDERIGTFARGLFTQMNGTHNIGGSLSLGVNFFGGQFGNGELDLNGGTLKVAKDVNIGVSGLGTIKANGGDMTVTGTITTKVNAGAVGLFQISGANVKAAKIVNNDSLGYHGGTLTADITNNAFFTLSGAGQRVVKGDVTNTATGVVKVSNTMVKWDGKFTDNGAYKSDPSENSFSDLSVGTTGYLQGGTGDVFSISGNFLNTSTQHLNWQTDAAELTFTGAGPHHVDFNADDFGANAVGYLNNFAWGDVTLAPGTELDIFDGNPNSSDTALYALVFDILGGDVGEVNYIHSNYNIYYDPTRARNAYLDDKNYQFVGLGCLIAIGNFGACQSVPIPEPAALWLLVVGLGGVLLARGNARRRPSQGTDLAGLGLFRRRGARQRRPRCSP